MPENPGEFLSDGADVPRPDPGASPSPEIESTERRPSRSRSRSEAALEGDELRVRLLPELHRLLRTQSHPGGWKLEELVAETLRHHLASRSPAIVQGNRILASADVARFWSRNPLETGLKLRSDRGTFLISTHPESKGYRQWQQHFTTLGVTDPDREARQMRLIQLQETLGTVDDFDPAEWRKEIRAEDFIVTEGVVADGGSSAGGDRQG